MNAKRAGLAPRIVAFDISKLMDLEKRCKLEAMTRSTYSYIGYRAQTTFS